MKIRSIDNYYLTDEERRLINIVNRYEFKLDNNHSIRFQDLLDRIDICLEGKSKRINKLPFSKELLEKRKNDLVNLINNIEDYIKKCINKSNSDFPREECENKKNNHSIRFQDLLDRVEICLKRKSEIKEELPFSKELLEKRKNDLENLINDLEDYINCINNSNSDSPREECENKKKYDDLLEDIINGEKNRQDEGGTWTSKLSSNTDVDIISVRKKKKELLYKWEKRASALIDKIENLNVISERYYEIIKIKGLFTPSAMEVTLYMDNMEKDDHGKRKKEDVVYVYIHEMLHAYFHCCFDKPGENVREVEECMAEFGALTLLEIIAKQDKNFNEVFTHAKNQVEAKQFTVGDLAAYGFGKYVFDHCAQKEKWLIAYSKKSLLLDANMPDVAEYVKLVYPFYPINEEYECFNRLERILFVDHHQSRYIFEHFQNFHDIALRILLVDDKVCGDIQKSPCSTPQYKDITELKELNVEKCLDVSCRDYQCKLCTIKRLMDDSCQKGEKKGQDGKSCVFDGIGDKHDYFYWKEQDIECFYCPTIIKDFIDDDNIGLKDHTKIQCNFEPLHTFELSNKERKSKVQIIGVKDVRTALLLLSRYKFDMLFVDYLLDSKEDGSNEREYSIQLFEFLSTDFDKKIQKETDEIKKEKYQLLAELRRAVLDNRGPLGKYWFMPITGFNQTFIQDLYRNHINLIDFRWNINNGADPITTPWQFLYHLNKFIELQLRACVYQRKQLLHFLWYTCDDLKEIEKQKGGIDFETFKSFMGSEYATFMQLYGNKLPIQRDALIGNEESDSKSVFATYIWNNFYSKPYYYDVIELNRLAQIFYHQASTMYNDRVGRQRLNEAFANLDFYIRTNAIIKEIINPDNMELSHLFDDEKGLGFLRQIISKCTKEKTTNSID